MTDLLIGSENDLVIYNGDLVLIDTLEVLIRQRIVNQLRTFTGTLFFDQDYGIDQTLMFQRGTQELLDQDIKDIVGNTEGVVSLVSFESKVDSVTRVYSCSFEYLIESGEIVGIANLGVGDETNIAVPVDGIWKDGKWDYSGHWDNKEIWGSD